MSLNESFSTFTRLAPPEISGNAIDKFNLLFLPSIFLVLNIDLELFLIFKLAISNANCSSSVLSDT